MLNTVSITAVIIILANSTYIILYPLTIRPTIMQGYTVVMQATAATESMVNKKTVPFLDIDNPLS